MEGGGRLCVKSLEVGDREGKKVNVLVKLETKFKVSDFGR
jgi:hypothetical protein